MGRLFEKFVDILALTVLLIYVAVISQRTDDERTNQSKRALPPTTPNKNFTFVNISGDCMLFFKGVSFTVYNYTEQLKSSGQVVTYSIPLQNFVEFDDTEKACHNYTGEITLFFNGVSGGPYNLKLDDLYFILNFKLNRPMSWWSIEKLEIDAKGSIIQPNGQFSRVYNGSEVKGFIEGPMQFCYACGRPQPFVFYEPPPEKDGKIFVKYAVNFTNLQVQPFSINRRDVNKQWYGFTEDVYDCVPFVSIGVWMFLISVSVLLFIVFCGIYMLASLKSNDRFDDIKGKPLVVNVKE